MLSNDRLIVTLTVEELKQIISECIENAPAKSPSKPEDDPLLKRSEVAKMFDVSLVTLNQWRREGLIERYKIKSRVFFKKSEILKVIESSLRKSNEYPYSF